MNKKMKAAQISKPDGVRIAEAISPSRTLGRFASKWRRAAFATAMFSSKKVPGQGFSFPGCRVMKSRDASMQSAVTSRNGKKGNASASVGMADIASCANNAGVGISRCASTARSPFDFDGVR